MVAQDLTPREAAAVRLIVWGTLLAVLSGVVISLASSGAVVVRVGVQIGKPPPTLIEYRED